MAITNSGKIDRTAHEVKLCDRKITDASHRLNAQEYLLVEQEQSLAELESLLGMVGAENLRDDERDKLMLLPGMIAETKAELAFYRRRLEALEAYRSTALNL